MTGKLHWIASTYTLLGFATLACALAAFGSGADDTWKRELASWRTERAKHLQVREGWLSLVGLDWLAPGDNTLGSSSDNSISIAAAPARRLGILRLEKDAVELLPPAGGVYPKDLLVDGHRPGRTQVIVDDTSGHPSKITAGRLSMVVIRRGAKLGVRTWDIQAPTLVGFHGLRWYEPNPQYRVEARWIPYTPPRRISLPTIIGTEESAEVPGVAEFSLQGQTLRLEPVIEEPGDQQLFFIIRDSTSKTETYQAARFLYTGFPDHGLGRPGKLVLDFNRAQNPPCAYTKFATCPLPPKGNVLATAIPAGEKRYHE